MSYYVLGDVMRLSDLQNKSIVSITDGKNIGNIIDAKIDEETGNIISLIFLTAFKTPLPWYLSSLSRSSNASLLPVEAPDGIDDTASTPFSRTIVTSKVGFDLLSRISLAFISFIFIITYQNIFVISFALFLRSTKSVISRILESTKNVPITWVTVSAENGFDNTNIPNTISITPITKVINQDESSPILNHTP